jgi:hypothetical protein
MKKLLTAILMVFSSYSLASAELGVNIGISGQAGLFAATATEFDKGTHGTTSGTNEQVRESEYLEVGFASGFLEKTLGDRFMVGVSYVPSAIATETNESVRVDYTARNFGTISATSTQKVQVDFKDMTTLYVGLNVSENAYVRLGKVTVDVITNETLGTGSTYGNASLDGAVVGFGYNHSMGNGIFIRGEGNYMNFDGTSVTSANGVNKISLDHLDGVSGQLSIGKSF